MPGFVLALAVASAAPAGAQETAGPALPEESSGPGDPHAQVPAFLTRSYFGLSAGCINTPLGDRQMAPGHGTGPVVVRHTGARVVLLGHQVHGQVAAEIGLMRPLRFITYTNLDGTGVHRAISVTVGDVSLRAPVRIARRAALYGTTGLALVSRRRAAVDGATVIRGAHFLAPIFGAGAQYQWTAAWDLVAGVTYVPARAAHDQPATVFGSTGARYRVQPLSAEEVRASRASGFVHPHRLLQVGVSTNALGYGLNNALSGRVPVFWGGFVQAAGGATVRYQHNVFHTRKIVALDLGGSAGYWRSHARAQAFLTLSAYPLLRFTLLRARPADVYVSYSAAGPAFISRRLIDDQDVGSRFTFQDLLGVGAFLGRGRRVAVELGIGHYSNGNMFPHNPGTKIPATFSVGWTF
jgi:hypothetical protein